MPKLRGGHNWYGFTVGILMNESTFPRPPGDLGNGMTFPFPVRLHVVKGAWYRRVVEQGDDALLDMFVAGARTLETEGVRVITTNCGFLAMFQQQLAASVSIPVFTSSLLLVPMVHRMLAPGRKIGILTVDSASLGERHYNGCGWSGDVIPIAVQGLQDQTVFTRCFREDLQEVDSDQLSADMVNAALTLLDREPDLGALVLECTNMAPYAHAVQDAVGGMPVFDIQTLVRFVHDACHQSAYRAGV
jgi:Asp/Glu/hydantoin racemase